jgi:hypothetical protein|tara:strand:- start:619 stop:1200 length:582 start_codon:yes stop_codon:yes gene_type:complete
MPLAARPVSLGAAALFMGTCSGHGTGCGSTHHAGLGGGVLPGCMKPPKDPKIVPRAVKQMDAVTIWPPTPQTPLTAITRNVLINRILPIIDQDLLITHPTPVTHQACYTGIPKGCPPGCVTNPAYWCTIGTEGGRESAKGHARKHMATIKTVFINARRAGVFGDPFGDNSVAFPCNSVVTGSSKNVFIGCTRG